jgi:thiamine monophosphate kinase
LEDAISGGEDYKLLITVERRKAKALAMRFQQEFGTPLYNIGRIKGRNNDGGFDFGLEDEAGDVIYSSVGWGGFSHF